MATSKQNSSENIITIDSDTENSESDSESFGSDDDSDDPTYNIAQETQSRFTNLSIKKRSKEQIYSDEDMDGGDELDEVEIVVPELDEEDKKSFENVQKIIQAGQLGILKVEQCKVYLRKYGLRLTGNKDTLILRIKEHLEVMDGGGEKKYPVSSFVLNCKGDACTGDIVMFEQKVFDMFNKVSRSASGPPIGTRIVAGRIVKESYGAAKQQHTFTIEVLWSKGQRPHPPLHPLLIKGRNLYRLRTLRQRWEDEGERQEALMEKHFRGVVARTDRESRMQEKEMRKMLKKHRKKDPNKNENQAKSSSAKNPRKPLSQTQHMQPLHSHQEQISRPQSHPVMTDSWNYPSQIANIGLTQFSTNPEFYNASHRSSYTSMNHYSPFTSLDSDPTMHHYPSTNQNPNLLAPWNHPTQRQSHYPSTNQRENQFPSTSQSKKQGQTRGQPCRHYAQGRCYYGDNCKFLHDQ